MREPAPRGNVLARDRRRPEHASPMVARAALSSWRWLLLLAGAACTTTPLAAPDAEQRLTQAEASIAAGAFAEALDVLGDVEGELCPKRLRDRRDLALATARQGDGELWEAFRVLETFPDLYPHSELRGTVVDKVWQIGEALARSDRGFLFFWSDARAGRTVLEHLITRHPDTQRLADALRILGDMAFDSGNYELAQARYRDLMLNRPDSEWYVYAQYRYAMSIVASLEGPEYDLDQMSNAERELRGFLTNSPENPELRRTSEETIARLLEWQADRHLRIAAFYRTVGNLIGQRHHLEIAAAAKYAGTSHHAEAVRLRDALPTTPSAPGATPP